MADRSMSIREHLADLRTRLLVCVLTLAATTTFSFIVAEDWIFPLLERPAPKEIDFLVTESTGVFGPYINVSLVAGAILAMPMFILQGLMFVAPALKPAERRYAYLMLPATVVAFGVGVVFAYFVLLPPALNFLYTFGSDLAEIRPALGKYVSLVTLLLFWNGVAFETPVILYFLTRVGLVSPSFLARNWRFAVLGAFVLGAFITPTLDPVNQTLVAVPLTMLYGLSLLLAKLAAYQHRKSQATAVHQSEVG